MPEASEARIGEVVYRFGAFELRARRQLLVSAGKPIRLGSRSSAILTLLVERAGELVTKEALMAAGWPDVFVHDADLTVTVSNLRRTLGDTAPRPTYIATVPRRGYRFIAQVVRQRGDALELLPAPALSELAQLPEARVVFGRDREIEEVVAFSRKSRLVTLVGPAGVGKTTIAVAAARRLQEAFPDGVCFIDLSLIQDDQLVPTLVASALGARGNPVDIIGGIVEFIANRKKLILLDNCEHVLSGVRALIPRILGSNSGTLILTTSRERLGAGEEALLQIQGLPAPELGQLFRPGGGARLCFRRAVSGAGARMDRFLGRAVPDRRRLGDLPVPRRPAAGARARCRAAGPIRTRGIARRAERAFEEFRQQES